MAKISESKAKSGGDAHTRLIGNKELGVLFSKIQSAVIRSGNELEKLIRDALPEEKLITLDVLAEIDEPRISNSGIQVVFKPSRPSPYDPKKKIQGDFLIVDHTKKRFTVVEVKDGYEFDTKKSTAELENLKSITSWLAQEFPYSAKFFICSFNQEDKAIIAHGLKNRFTLDQILTGREFCQLIGIDYDKLRATRDADIPANRRYFLTELLKIPQIRREIVALLEEIDT